jgi:hypothetical protein
LDIAQYFLDNVNLAKKYLEEILDVNDQANDTTKDEDDATKDAD